MYDDDRDLYVIRIRTLAWDARLRYDLHSVWLPLTPLTPRLPSSVFAQGWLIWNTNATWLSLTTSELCLGWYVDTFYLAFASVRNVGYTTGLVSSFSNAIWNAELPRINEDVDVVRSHPEAYNSWGYVALADLSCLSFLSMRNTRRFGLIQGLLYSLCDSFWCQYMSRWSSAAETRCINKSVVLVQQNMNNIVDVCRSEIVHLEVRVSGSKDSYPVRLFERRLWRR